MAAASSSYTTTRVREAEHHTASACKFEAATLSINSGDESDATSSGCWGIYVENESENNVNAAAFSSVHIPPENMADYAAGGGTAAILTDSGDDSGSKKKKNLVPCQALAEGTTMRVAPMERSSGGWSPDHFHEHLRLPTATTTTGGGAGIKGGIVVLLEAMAHECLAIALSPDHDYVLGKTYVVHFGANGNLQTVLRRHVNYTECIDVAIPSRVCSEEKWISYWIVLQHGKLSAGVGKIPGKHCIGTLDDSMYDMLRSGVDAVKYVGIGNSALKRNARDLRVRNVRVCGIPSHFGLEGVPMETGGGGGGGVGGEEGDDGSTPTFKFVNILEMDEFFGRGGSGSSGRMVESYMPSDAELLAEYEKERTKARARATKFGIEYHEPPPDAFLKWSEARRLRANPEKGFITGIDTFSTVEKDKALARKRRFALEKRKAEGGGGGGGMEEEDDENIENSIDVGEGEEGEDAMLGDDDYYDEEDNVAEWEKAKKDPLPVEQAWENWNIVQQFRVDPPPTQTESGSNGVQDEVGTMEGDIPFLPFKQSATIVPTKIHLFSIDWAPFKQIRTDDILSYFRDYGPSYVEWLGEISCNVLFEDKYSAARAFHAMSQELPSPPPQTSAGDGLVDASADGSTIMMESAEHESTNTGEEERNGMDVADVAAADDNTPKDSANQEVVELLPDYGSMGWRFCKWTVRKVRYFTSAIIKSLFIYPSHDVCEIILMLGK
jgi:hypothetical protein